ncbi:MAG TPA: hypothetical protein VF546_23160 [Pyrinomonadaceae bacterium]|jgi:hypothetical protein
MFQEYLNRTYFVVLHGLLLALYLLLLGRSYVRLRRERKTLRGLPGATDEPAAGSKELDGFILVRPKPEQDETAVAPQGSEAEGQRRLARLQTALAAAPDTALRRQLRAIVGTTAAGEDFDTQRVLTQLGRSLADADDLIRFCINGLVIVGLMGTLFAFYQMWGTHGTTNLTAANSTLYLESMSTALLVSFVGLILALVTNFFFSLLRARRQALLDEVAAFLAPVAGLLPTDAKTHLLLTNLLAPLNRLVEQLTRQNDQVLRGLTEAVHTRTEQLNRLIEQATADWQAAIGAFRAETLTAVNNMQQASGRLADSSLHVAGTLREVSQALQQTKEIGRLVAQLESSSGQVIATIAGRLDAATEVWVATYARAVQAYEDTLQRQSATVEKVGREMTVIIRDDLNQLVTHALAEFDALKGQLVGSLGAVDERLAASLNALGQKFAVTLEDLGTKWQTEAAAATDATVVKLEAVVNGWQVAVTDTTQTVASSLADSRETLAGSRELVRQTTENVNALSGDLAALQTLLRAMEGAAGAPVYLGQAAERLGLIGEALTELAARLEYGRALQQLQTAVVASHDEVRALGQQVAALGGATQQEQRKVGAQLGALDARFDGVDKELAALRADVARRPARREAVRRPPPPPPPTIWEQVLGYFSWVPKPRGAKPGPDGAQPAPGPGEPTIEEERPS